MHSNEGSKVSTTKRASAWFMLSRVVTPGLLTLSSVACGSSWLCRASGSETTSVQPQVIVIHEGALTVLPKGTEILLPDGKRLSLKAAPMWLVSEAWVNQQHQALLACVKQLKDRTP